MKIWDVKVCIECRDVWSKQAESLWDKDVCPACGNKSGISLKGFIKATEGEEVFHE